MSCHLHRIKRVRARSAVLERPNADPCRRDFSQWAPETRLSDALRHRATPPRRHPSRGLQQYRCNGGAPSIDLPRAGFTDDTEHLALIGRKGDITTATRLPGAKKIFGKKKINFRPRKVPDSKNRFSVAHETLLSAALGIERVAQPVTQQIHCEGRARQGRRRGKIGHPPFTEKQEIVPDADDVPSEGLGGAATPHTEEGQRRPR